MPGTVIEKNIYSSRDAIVNTPATYNLNITSTTDGYTQTIPEITIDSAKSKLTEEYQSVGKTQKSLLDGVWKELNSFVVKGNDTIKNNRTQYKVFYDGYFMFGQTNIDSASKTHTGIGFGTFEMNGDNKMKETDLNSTYSMIAGKFIRCRC